MTTANELLQGKHRHLVPKLLAFWNDTSQNSAPVHARALPAGKTLHTHRLVVESSHSCLLLIHIAVPSTERTSFTVPIVT